MPLYNKINYRRMYPDASDEIIKVLEQSDHKMEYLQVDLKVGRTIIDKDNKRVHYQPSREDSLDQLMDDNKQFESDVNVLDIVVQKEILEKLYQSLSLLDDDELQIIQGIFLQAKRNVKWVNSLGCLKSQLKRDKTGFLRS